MISVLILLLALSFGGLIFLGIKLYTLKCALRKLSEQVTYTLDDTSDRNVGDFQKYTEGELAVLESQIGKMVNLLREQAQGLLEDKHLLKDAMANMSHQLKTPMTSLQLILSMLADESLEQEERLEYVEHATMLLNRVDWLVSTLLKLSRLDAGTIQFAKARVDFQELARALVRQVELSIDIKNQTFVSHIQEGSGFEGDFGWTLEAVLNIMKNCVEHTPEGRCLYLTMSENAVYSEIVIEDEGPGIPVDERRKIFERFYQGKNASANSVGIGLALSADLIRKQNGTVKAESRREGGARFVIRFYRQVI